MLEAREISLLSGSFLNDDIFGDETFEGIDCQLADLGLKSLPAESRGNAFLPFIANPYLPKIDDRCGHADKEEEKQPNRPANEKRGIGGRCIRAIAGDADDAYKRFTGSTSTATKTSSGNGRTARVC